jgi:hypothetical protein
MTFQADEDATSPSGVGIAKDFRDNLIIDRYDPVFADMRASKLKHMRSVNSEDAVTWNVFRSLRQITPAVWLPSLWSRAFPKAVPLTDTLASVKLWVSVPPPLGLLESGDEGPSEVDVVIETATWVWFIEAKYQSDISPRTTTRAGRDQIVRNIDVGSYYAGVRQFLFSLLMTSKTRSPIGDKTLTEYSDHSAVREKLKGHRKDGLRNLAAIGLLKWYDLSEVLRQAGDQAGREDERAYASRALTWLRDKGLASPQ